MTYPMTGTAIADFLAKATGPSELVSGLRSMTRVLGVFFKEVGHINSLQAKIPPGVLEGGLSGLLSKKLQQLLDYSNQPGELENKSTANRPGFTGPFQIEEANKNKSIFDHGAAEDTIKDFAPGKQAAEIKNNGYKPVPLPHEDKGKTAAIQGQFQQAMQGHRESRPGLTGSDGHSLPVKEISTGGDEQEGGTPRGIFVEELNEGLQVNRVESSPESASNPWPPVDRGKRNEAQSSPGSIFVEKLNEYFHLNREEPSPEPGTHPFPAVDRGRGKRDQGKAPSFSFAAAETSRLNPGHQMTEEQVAREINAFINGRGDFSPAERSRQVFSTNGTGDGDLRIQNTFNINLDHDGSRETGTLGSLTEKIGDILREQALQHGIDIT